MLEELSQAARRVGHALAQWRAENRIGGRQCGTQFKADVDRWAHDLWCRELATISPGTRIVSEEDPSSHDCADDAGYWLIDPLDGTASFVGGFSGWVTQAVWMEGHRPKRAVVYAPITDELFAASYSAGAYRNGKRLQVNSAGAAGSLIDNYPQPRGIAAAVMAHLGISRYIESGSLGLKICRVADGKADVFVKDVLVRSWDVAPAELILSEAGGCFVTLAGHGFAYDGALQHLGLIASHSSAVCAEIAAWAASRAPVSHV